MKKLSATLLTLKHIFHLHSLCQGKTLVACSKKGLEDAGFSNDIHSNSQRLITFSEFNRASVKSKVLSIREMFGKQLVQLHGLTVEKALAVLEVYPTPNRWVTGNGTIFDRLVWDCSTSSALAVELSQSCAKLLIWCAHMSCIILDIYFYFWFSLGHRQKYISVA